MSTATQSSLIGAAFAATAAVVFVSSVRLILARRRPSYFVQLSLFVVILMVGPLALTQLAQVQWHFGIVLPQERDLGFDIYIVVLLSLAIFAIWQINRYNKRNRESTPTI